MDSERWKKDKGAEDLLFSSPAQELAGLLTSPNSWILTIVTYKVSMHCNILSEYFHPELKNETA